VQFLVHKQLLCMLFRATTTHAARYACWHSHHPYVSLVTATHPPHQDAAKHHQWVRVVHR
jgi:hypothetical protein